MSGDKVFPPYLTHDEFAIVNPDFWDHGVDRSAFKEWMRMTMVRTWVYFLFE